MSLVNILIDTDASIEELKNLDSEKPDLRKLMNFLQSIAGGVRSAQVKLQVEPNNGKIKLTFTGKPTEDQTVVIGSGTATNTYVAKDDLSGAGYTGLWFAVGTDGAANATNLAACITAGGAYSDPPVYSATASASSVTIAVGVAGLIGEFVQLTETCSNLAVDFANGSTGIYLPSDGTVTTVCSK